MASLLAGNESPSRRSRNADKHSRKMSRPSRGWRPRVPASARSASEHGAGPWPTGPARRSLRFALVVATVVLWATQCFTMETVPLASAADLLERAREAAANDRHREAIDLYLRAAAEDSMLRSTVSIELGHQYTWAETPDSAILWYEAYLRERPGDIDARIGIARAMSWDDRLSEAERYYEETLDDAGERRNEVMIGLGGALNWSGKHREARAVFRTVLADDGGNADAVKGLAEAEVWSGRPDRAAEVIEDAAANGVRNEDLERLAEEIERMTRPRGETEVSWRENRDDGVIRAARGALTFPIGHLTEVGGAYTRSKLHKLGFPDIDRDEFSVSARHRLTDSFMITAAPGYQLNRFDAVAVPPGARPVEDFDLVVWDAYVTVTPRDWLRVDAGTSRQAMDIPVPVFRRLDVTTENIGLDWRLTHRLATFWETKYSAYSDGNSRAAASERAEWTSPLRVPLVERGRMTAIQGVEYSSFAKQPESGYFSPRSYVYAYGGARLTGDLGKRLSVNVDGRLGGERDGGQGWANIGAFEVTLRARLARSLAVVGGYFKSGSRLDSPDGFRAEGAFVTLEYGGAQ